MIDHRGVMWAPRAMEYCPPPGYQPFPPLCECTVVYCSAAMDTMDTYLIIAAMWIKHLLDVTCCAVCAYAGIEMCCSPAPASRCIALCAG